MAEGYKISEKSGMKIDDDGFFSLYLDDVCVLKKAACALELVDAKGKNFRVECTKKNYQRITYSEGKKNGETDKRIPEIKFESDDYPQVRLAVSCMPGSNGFRLSMNVDNDTASDLTLNKMVPLIVECERYPELGVFDRLFRLGYQSWSPSGTIFFKSLPERSLFSTVGIMSRGSSLWNLKLSDSHREEWMAMFLDASEGRSMLIGFSDMTKRICGVDIVLKKQKSGLESAEAWDYAEKRILRKGEKIDGQELIILAGHWPEKLLNDYIDYAASRNEIELKDKTMKGWCSWYAYHDRISSRNILENTRRIAELNCDHGLEYILVDDGWQSEVGDWMNHKASMEGGMETLCGSIRELGFKPALWIAPFLAARRSELFKHHPDWFIRDGKGRARYAGFNVIWKSRVYALDASNEDFLSWLRHVIETAVEKWGVELLKLDFLYAAVLDGYRSESDICGARALRKGLEAIRESAGNIPLIGCGCPLGPAIGLVDVMRIGTDTGRRWRYPWIDRLMGLPVMPSLYNNLKGTMTRFFLDGRWWKNDPDCLYLQPLSHDRLSATAAAAMMTSDFFFFSDLIGHKITDSSFFNAVHPIKAGKSGCPDLFKKENPMTLWRKNDRDAGLLVFAGVEKGFTPCIKFDDLGIHQKCLIFDLQNETATGRNRDRLEPQKIGAGECITYRITPERDRPFTAASTFLTDAGIDHIDERVTCENGQIVLQINLSLPFDSKGKLFVAVPDSCRYKSSESSAFNEEKSFQRDNMLIIEGTASVKAEVRLTFQDTGSN